MGRKEERFGGSEMGGTRPLCKAERLLSAQRELFSGEIRHMEK
jgi:hypothetical protein